MTAIADPGSTPEFIRFKADAQLNPERLFQNQSEAFGLRGEDAMTLENETSDRLGFRHLDFQQHYRGLRVEGMRFKVHVNAEGRVYAANGRMVRGLELPANPVVSSENAVAIATAALRAELGQNASLRRNPQSELLITRIESGDFSAQNHTLAFAVTLETEDAAHDRIVYVDAHSGEAFRHRALSMVCDAGTVNTTWNGTESISTQSTSSGFTLSNDCGDWGGGDLDVLNGLFGSSKAASVPYYDLNNVWNGGDGRDEVSGATTLWAIQLAKEYFFDEHSMDSYDDAGGDMTIYNNIRINGTSFNACYCGGDLLFGTGGDSLSNADDYGTIDIAGHEWTHAVVDYTADLEYQWESGALNESFADIFGTVIEQWYEGGSYDWELGEDRGNALRDLADPNSKGDPHTYQGVNYIATAGCTPSSGTDFCGVHTNSGVQNKWFHLLVEGGSGTNDLGDSYTVSGIGFSRARDIAFRNLASYLGPTSGYQAARTGSIQAAEDLFGACSPEAKAVADAWFAVGVAQTSTVYDRTVCGTINPWFPSVIEGISSVTAADGCTNTIGAPLLVNGSVAYRAGDFVELRPGFETLSGAVFEAYTDDCSHTYTRLADHSYDGHADGPATAESTLTNPAAAERMELSPNPFRSSTTLDFRVQTEEALTARVYDAMGRMVFMQDLDRPFQTMQEGTISIQLEGQAAGTYVLRLEGRTYGSQPLKLLKIE